MKEFHRGAEAVIYLDNDRIVKKRVKKGYRLKKLDNDLRGQRTRREATVLQKLAEKGIPGPEFFGSDDEETLEMEYIDGERLADCLSKNNVSKIMKRVGEVVALFHDAGMAHGDLTTSNMILRDGEVHLIDFGLSFFSRKTEDKAVDIHLLKEALEAKHYDVYEEALTGFKKGYKKSKNYDKAMKRLEKVEKRGRYKGK